MGESALGRAKLKLYELISGREHWIPEDSEVRRFIRSKYRKNPAAGRVFLIVLTENSLKRVSFGHLSRRKDIGPLLHRLEEDPLEWQSVLELSNCPEPLSSVLGVCLHRESLADDGYVYIITLFDNEGFPMSFLEHIEIRACQKKPQPIFSTWSGSDFDCYNERNYKESWFADFAIRLLDYLDKNRPVTMVPLSKIAETEFHEDEVHRPPEDKQFTKCVVAVLRNELACTLATVPLEKIKPFSLDFCLTYPRKTVAWETQQIKQGDVPTMTVYWDRDHFVMNDDYSAYLAHRFLKSEAVPIAILGEFPAGIAMGDVTVGGPELIPPVRIIQGDNYDSLTPEIKEWLIDSRLQHKATSPVAATLSAVAMVLSEILSESSTDEKRIHKFLAQYPIIVDAHGSSMMSELRLGNEYRVDLAIQYNLDDKRLLLIELEHPRASLFTAKGRPRSHVTHALQQVEDWLRWWREHPNDVPKGLDPTIPIEGLVVIGRNKSLKEPDTRRLLHLNKNREVKLITYDELLEKLEVLIQNLESLD
jgi:hypothetical protein